MRKALLLCLVVVALLVMASAAFAADIAVTVTLQSVGVTLNQSSWPIGIIAPLATANLTGVEATNSGNVSENFTISCTGSTAWSPGGTAGLNVFKLEAGSTVVGTTPVSLATSVAAGAKSTFDLHFQAPSAGSATTAQSFTVTVAATAS
jgi:hypothetical protein